jgi:hypothetical protein
MEEVPTTVGRLGSGPRPDPATPQGRSAWEEEDLTVSTVSDAMRPLTGKPAPARQRRVVIGVAVAGGVVVTLAVLLWKIMSTGEEPTQAPMQVGAAALVVIDAGGAAEAAAAIDAGSAVIAPQPVLPPPVAPPAAPQGRLTLQLPAGIKVAIDGRDPVLTPVQDLALPVGHHKLVVSDGRHKWRGDVVIVDGLTAEPKVRLR